MALAEEILELARWAPSGDNSQPWRFRIVSEREIEVYGYDTRDHCVYDLDGWSSELAHGMLLETIAVAAARHGARASFGIPGDDAARPLRYVVRLAPDPAQARDPLSDFITDRAVQRRPMGATALSADQRAALERAAHPLRIRWFESWPERLGVAILCARNARIRMTIPEAYEVHRSVIAWHAKTSVDRLPDASLGAGPVLLAMMRHAMASWTRLDRTNRWTGTLVPRLRLDFLPGVLCSAQLAIMADRPPATLPARLAAGRAIQRAWLTAASLGLQMQPQYTPLVFARYAKAGRKFSRAPGALGAARAIASSLDATLGEDSANAVWLARIGPRRALRGRSLRLPLAALLVDEPPSSLPPLAPSSLSSRTPSSLPPPARSPR